MTGYKLLVVLFFLTVGISGCIAPRPIGDFVVRPYMRSNITKTKESITLVVSPAIKEMQYIRQQPADRFHFTQFRSSVITNFERLLAARFAEVRTADQTATDGLTLYVHRLEPRFELEGLGEDSEINRLTSAVFAYDVELLENGQTVASAVGDAKGPERFTDRTFWNIAMRSAMERTLEEVYAKFFIEGLIK